MERVSRGSRVGTRRAEKPKRSFSTPAFLHALGITACMIAWGYLVYAAIDFGTSARAGEGAAWVLLGLASLGAVACLFVGLMLVVRVLRLLGVLVGPDSSVAPPPAPGRRIARPNSGVATPYDTAGSAGSSGPVGSPGPVAPSVPAPRRTTPGGRRAAR